MKFTLITVGKVKEAFYRDAIEEYVKRLSRYGKINIVEVADEKTPDACSDAETEGILRKEAERISGKIPEDAFLCTLEIEGDKLDSVSFAKKIDHLGISGVNHLAFVIGGSLGLHSSIKSRSDFALSFSDMTFPHQLMRVILLEQLYRAMRINANAPYHK